MSPSSWTPQTVLQLAPDDSSAQAGQALASPRKWLSLGTNDLVLWGEIAGSGKTPYQARVELGEPAFKCTCPSRKFPCKHSLGLLLILAANAAAVPRGDPPAWVADWLAEREKRAERKVAKAAAPEAQPDPAAAAKRVAKREARIEDGIGELSVWLADLMRLGLARAQAQPFSFWDEMGARLVDAQAPGLAARVRGLESRARSGKGWEQRTLRAIGHLQLLCTAYANQAALDEGLRHSVRKAIGWRGDGEAEGECVKDRWLAAGSVVFDADDRVTSRRTWLFGTATRRWGLLLDFAAGNQPLAPGPPPGALLDGELRLEPGALPLRGAFVEPPRIVPEPPAVERVTTIEAMLDRYAGALAALPWLERWPVRLDDVRLARDRAAGWSLVDGAQASLPLAEPGSAPPGAAALAIASVTGGEAFALFAEYHGESLRPLTVMTSAGGYSFGDKATLLPLRPDHQEAR